MKEIIFPKKLFVPHDNLAQELIFIGIDKNSPNYGYYYCSFGKNPYRVFYNGEKFSMRYKSVFQYEIDALKHLLEQKERHIRFIKQDIKKLQENKNGKN